MNMLSPTTNEQLALLPCLTKSERAKLDRLLRAPSPLWQPDAQNLPQQAAYQSKADILGYGGAAGGGKSDLILGLAITRHQRSLILRKQHKDLSALTDRARDILGTLGSYNANTGVWRALPGNRQIEFGGLKDPGDEQHYRGRPHDFIGIDEADQVPQFQVRFVLGWLRTTDPRQRCRAVLGFNPPASSDGRWLIDFFGAWLDPKHLRPALSGELRWYATLPDGTETERPDGKPFTHAGETITPLSRTFLPARVADNPYLMATGYPAQLQALPEPLRSQLLHGDFRAGMEDEPWQVIPTAWVEAAQARWTPTPPPEPEQTCLGVDVAYGGADQTVIAARHGTWFGPLKRYRGEATDSGQKAGLLVLKEHNGKARIHVDGIGYGAACHEALREKVGGLAVAVNVALPSGRLDCSRKYKLTNIRSAMYWLLREALDPETGDSLALPPDRELLADLTAPRYQVRASGIVVEAKQDIKERLGRSPDSGDAVALAHYPMAYAGVPTSLPNPPRRDLNPQRYENTRAGRRGLFGMEGER
jgi:hypothetical protein